MFLVHDIRAGAFSTVELRDGTAGARVVLVPARGGMVTRFDVHGEPIFYLDEETLHDPQKNATEGGSGLVSTRPVRGGNPVLFPSPGKLEGDRWERGGKSGSMKQHGFARNLAWEVASRTTSERASVTLRLESSDVTKAMFPWEFVAQYTYSLVRATLHVDVAVTNTDREPMPFGAGFHPYFAVPEADKAGCVVQTAATRAFDNVTKKEVGFAGFELATSAEVDLHLLDHPATASEIAWGGKRVAIRASPEFTHWVVWTLRGKDFVCVEPWTCPGNALNTGDRLIELPAGDTRRMWIEYAVL
jgi:galactose mutarotase-like enzyme